MSVDGKSTLFLVDLWYFPNGYTPDVVPVIVPSDAREIGFYSVPDFMTMRQGDLTHYAPMRSLISIESWVHVYFASIIFSNFGRAGRVDTLIENSVFAKLRFLWKAVLEQRQILQSSAAVEIGPPDVPITAVGLPLTIVLDRVATESGETTGAVGGGGGGAPGGIRSGHCNSRTSAPTGTSPSRARRTSSSRASIVAPRRAPRRPMLPNRCARSEPALQKYRRAS